MVIDKKVIRILLVVCLSITGLLYSADYRGGFDGKSLTELLEAELPPVGDFSVTGNQDEECELFGDGDGFDVIDFCGEGFNSVGGHQENREPNISPVRNGAKKRKRTQESGDPRYACKELNCQFQGGGLADLTRHTRKHTGEKPYVCSIEDCDYSAARSSSVKEHEKRHNPENVLACEFKECVYETTVEQCLELHKRTHTGEKPYACTVEGCSYKTAQNNLARHKLVHTGEKPYACNVNGCSYRTRQQGYLKSHMKKHVIEIPAAGSCATATTEPAAKRAKKK